MISEYVRLKIGTNKIRLNLPEFEQYPLLTSTPKANTRQHNANPAAQCACRKKHTNSSKLSSFKFSHSCCSAELRKLIKHCLSVKSRSLACSIRSSLRAASRRLPFPLNGLRGPVGACRPKSLKFSYHIRTPPHSTPTSTPTGVLCLEHAQTRFPGNPVPNDHHLGVSIVMGVPPIAAWFCLGKIPSRNGWWLVVPLFQETPS